MPRPTEDDERKLAVAREFMDRHHVVFSVLAQGENSPYMTDEFRQQLAEAKERLVPYTIAERAMKIEGRK